MIDLNFAGNEKISFFLHSISLLNSQQLLSSVSALKDPVTAPAISDIHPSAISEIGHLTKSHTLHGVRSQSDVTAVTQDVIAHTQSSLFSVSPSPKGSIAMGQGGEAH